jgi:glycolate oxidase iron-sulfur subunit
MHLLTLKLAAAPSARFREIFARCLLCGACEQVCSRNLPITELVIRARSRFPELYGPHPLQKKAVRTALAHPDFLERLVRAGIRLSRLKRLPLSSGLRLKLGLLEQEQAVPDLAPIAASNSGKEIYYFSGCLAGHVQPSIGRATAALARASGFDPHLAAAQGCCGLAALAAGRLDEARRLAWRNIQAFADTSGPILTSCASCSSHLRHYGELFAGDPERQEAAQTFADRVHEFSAFFLGQASLSFSLPIVQSVFYHDPCHQRCTRSGREAPRQLLDRVVHLKRIEPVDGPHCCGQGGLFHIGYPGLSGHIFKRCLDAALPGQPDLVTTTCSGCLMQWQAGVQEHGLSVRVVHLACLLADSLASNSDG